MSSPAPIADASTTTSDQEQSSPDRWPDAPANDLATLRATLDGIDNELQALLIRRARVIEAVAKSGKPAALRPGREAAIIRRLIGQHQGGLPRQALYRIWREMLAATTAMQGGFSMAVCDPHPGAAYTQLAREQYGALTPLRVHGSVAQAIAEMSAGTASVAIVPLPSESETWWTTLLHPGIHVVARLPFWSARPEGSPTVQALVLSPAPPDASGHDRSLLGLELDEDVSRARLNTALHAAGFTPGAVLLRRDQAAPVAHALVEIDGHVTPDDKRLDALGSVQRRPLVLGGYAIPLEGLA